MNRKYKNNRRTFRTVIVTVLITVLVLAGYEYITGFSPFSRKTTEERKFQSVLSLVRSNFYEELDENKVIEAAIRGMVESIGDRYTRYMNEEEWRESRNSVEGSYEGIGIIANVDAETNLPVIYKVFDNSPAKNAGILEGDIIIKINDTVVKQFEDYVSMDSAFYNDDIREIILTVKRPSDNNREHTFTMKKETIEVQNLFAEKIEDDIIYVRMTMFDSRVADEFKENVNKYMEEGGKYLIVDLRGNPGGYFDTATSIASYLLPNDKVIATTVFGSGNESVSKASGENMDIPVVFIVDGNSASASEVLSGAIKGNDRGKIVGEKTFGKGLVQRPFGFKDGTGINITIASYRIPTGENIHGVGITPDFEVKLPEEYVGKSDIPFKKDTQLQKAIEVVRK